MKATSSETEKLIDVINIKTEALEAEEEPVITEGKGGQEEEGEENGENGCESSSEKERSKFLQ